MNYSTNSILSDRISVTAENDLWMAAEAHGSLAVRGTFECGPARVCSQVRMLQVVDAIARHVYQEM